MDVSKNEKTNNEDLGGQELIETLVSLSGLPEPLAHEELDEILKMSGHTPGTKTDLTLDQLRAALLVYLEALQPTSIEE